MTGIIDRVRAQYDGRDLLARLEAVLGGIADDGERLTVAHLAMVCMALCSYPGWIAFLSLTDTMCILSLLVEPPEPRSSSLRICGR
jgi:hypothetical protein